MKITIVNRYSPELERDVAMALPADTTDPYLAQFRTTFPFPSIMRFLIDDKRGISRFVDVGANIGQTTVSAAALGLDCVSIEPEPHNYVLLCQATIANGFTNVRPVHTAASDAPRVLRLIGEGGYATVVDDTAFHDRSILVPALPLDNMLPLHGFETADLVKIDVEGHEAAVIHGMKKLIEVSRPLLILESNTWTLGGVAQARRLLEMVEELNYVLYLFMRDGSVVKRPSGIVQPIAVVDFLAVPEGSAKARALPRIRSASLEEELAMMEAEPLDSGPHVLHLCQVISSLEDSSARPWPRLERLRNRIATGNADVISFLRQHYPPPQPSWLVT